MSMLRNNAPTLKIEIEKQLLVHTVVSIYNLIINLVYVQHGSSLIQDKCI